MPLFVPAIILKIEKTKLYQNLSTLVAHSIQMTAYKCLTAMAVRIGAKHLKIISQDTTASGHFGYIKERVKLIFCII